MATDLTPKSIKSVSADRELKLPVLEMPLGQNVGGLQIYSNSFKRGHGAKVFGSDENGLWLGAADYIDAPFKVSMEGEIFITDADGAAYISPKVLIFYNAGVPSIVIGDPTAAP